MERHITAIKGRIEHWRYGYTLIETMIVIGLLGVISALVAPIYLQTWRVSKANANQLPIGKIMRAMSEMDLGARHGTELAFVKYNGEPSATTPEFVTWDSGECEGFAFRMPVTDINTTITGYKWVSYQITKRGIWRYVWENDSLPTVSAEYTDTAPDIYKVEFSSGLWRGLSDTPNGYPGIQVYEQKVYIKSSENELLLPFSVPVALNR